MILLDTSVLVDLEHVTLPEESVALSSLTYAELAFGIESAATPALHSRRLNHRRWLEHVLGNAWLAFDQDAAVHYGKLASVVARTRPAHARTKDIMLAGHALSLGAKLVTLNPKDFSLVADEVEIVVPQRRS